MFCESVQRSVCPLRLALPLHLVMPHGHAKGAPMSVVLEAHLTKLLNDTFDIFGRTLCIKSFVAGSVRNFFNEVTKGNFSER